MKMLVLNAETKTELEAANYNGDANRQLIPVALADGRFGLNADLLQDCGPGQTWEFYREFLGSLSLETIDSLPETEII